MSASALLTLRPLHAPLTFAVNATAAALLNSSSSSYSSEDILLHNFDRDKFMQVMLVYAAPCVAAILVRRTRATHTHGGGVSE